MQMLQPAAEEHGAQFVADQADHNERVSASYLIPSSLSMLPLPVYSTHPSATCSTGSSQGLYRLLHVALISLCGMPIFRALVHSNSDLVTAKFLLLLQNVHHTAVNMVVTLPSEHPVSPNCLPLLCSNAFTRSAEY